MFKMIKGVILDLDGVYFQNGTKNFLDSVSERFGVNREDVAEIYLKSEEMQQYKKGEIDEEKFWDFFVISLNIESSKEELLEILQEGYEKNPLADEILRRLKKEGINSIICTNNFKERINVLDEKFDFVRDFDLAIFSYDFGMLKPFLLEKVVEKSGLKSEEILLLDDGKGIIDGAKEMNFNAELCEHPEEVLSKLEKYNI